MALEGGALAGAWVGGLLAAVLVLALLLYLFRWFMQVLQIHFDQPWLCLETEYRGRSAAAKRGWTARLWQSRAATLASAASPPST